MLKGMLTLGKNKDGATAIEFAMVAPVLIWLIFGMIEFGIMMATQSALEGATSQAGRAYKALARSNNETGADASAIHSRIAQIGNGLLIPARLRITARQISWGGSEDFGGGADENEGYTGTTGDIIQYRAFYDYPIHTPFLANVLGGGSGTVSLVASTVVQNEPSIGGGGGV